ncbi:hypothetical protein HDV62DRAFT_357541 [Trichoderma sp. SZMC 28011]
MALPRWPTQFYVFCLIPLVHAYTVFETNCSAPVTKSNYVSSPNTRGTLDILWSSLFTIFACTWTLQHPNVSKQGPQDGPRRQGHDDVEPRGQVSTKRGGWRFKWECFKWGLENFGRSALRMLATIFAPELIIAAAFDEWLAAHDTLKEIKRYFEYNVEDKVPWSLRHSYYANMGGFAIQLRGKPIGEVPVSFRPYAFDYFGFRPFQPYHNPYYLNGRGILALRQGEHISKLPNIKEEEIRDKSKGDALVKIIALGQILWSIIQIIARAVRDLPVSPLEVAVVAYASCAVIIYVAYWNKPQRIGFAHTIQLDIQKTETPPEEGDIIPYEILQDLNGTGSRRFFGAMIKPGPAVLGAPISLDSINSNSVTEDNENGEDTEDVTNKVIPLIAALFAIPFGAIHAAAWNFAFPSAVELMLWRWISIYMIAAPLCTWLLFYLRDKLKLSKGTSGVFPGPLAYNILLREKYLQRLWYFTYLGPLVMGFVYLFLFLYFLARVFILIEMFRTLCFLPPRSYISTWTTNLPHLA